MLHSRGIVPEVLYPAVQVPSDAELQAAHAQWQMHVSAELRQFMQAGPLFVSINRFERKKVSHSMFATMFSIPIKLLHVL